VLSSFFYGVVPTMKTMTTYYRRFFTMFEMTTMRRHFFL
jgi:hypothetical protein